MIVSVSGLIGSGKDTVSQMLVEQYNFEQWSFADTLKDAVAAIFNWDREMLSGKTAESRKWREEVDTWWAKRLDMPHLTPRWVLQYFGTNVCRNHFSEDIWLASLENKLQHLSEYNIVISDARFRNEVDMLKRLGAKMVCVQRGELPNWWETAKNAHNSMSALKTMTMLDIHASEWDWAGCDFDITIKNDGTLADLNQAVTNLVTPKNQDATSSASNVPCYC